MSKLTRNNQTEKEVLLVAWGRELAIHIPEGYIHRSGKIHWEDQVVKLDENYIMGDNDDDDNDDGNK